jgi:hypothetical protein
MEKIEVVISNQTDKSDNPVSLPDNVPSSHTIPPEQAERNKEKGMNVAGLVAVNQLTPYITQAINFGISQISMNVGSDELQRKAQVMSSMGGTAASIGMAALTGGIPGAAIMAGIQLMNGLISMEYNKVAIANQKQIENENIALRKSRAGLSANKSRTGGTA